MTTENVVTTSHEPEPEVETQAPTEQETSEQVSVESEQKSSPPESEKAETQSEDTKPKGKPWFQKRIDELTAQKYEKERDAEKAANENAVLRAALEAMQKGEEPPAKLPGAAPQDFESAVQAEAARIAKLTDFNTRCNAVADRGFQEFPDFKEAAEGYGMLGGAPQEYLEAVTSIPDGHKVYHYLGKNLDEAAHVLRLPPVQMALEIARISQKLNTPAKPVLSKAPAPITPLDGTSRNEFDPEKEQDMDKFAKWFFNRQAERSAR